MVRKIFGRSSLFLPLRRWLRRRRQERERTEWVAKGRPAPVPHIVKETALRDYANRFQLRILVETGTHYGDMVEALIDVFNRIYSIELSHELWAKAHDRFRGQKHIEIVHGDSGKELGRLLSLIDGPALFWLDGHYSGGNTARGSTDTPIFAELQHILGAPDRGHVIVIDDARCFGADPAYPSIEDVRQLVRSNRPDLDITVEEDSIRITPARDRESNDDGGVP